MAASRARTWRATYEGWPVIKKLEYVAELMEEIRGEKPAVVSREHVEPVRKLRKTLGEHYAKKRDQYGINLPNLYDQHLRRLFSDAPEYARRARRPPRFCGAIGPSCARRWPTGPASISTSSTRCSRK